MGKLGDITDKLEHQLQAIIEPINVECKGIFRRFRYWRDEAVVELYEITRKELIKRKLIEANHDDD